MQYVKQASCLLTNLGSFIIVVVVLIPVVTVVVAVQGTSHSKNSLYIPVDRRIDR